jgi:DNA-directed RNA polymerase specialized sigma24 family protein
MHKETGDLNDYEVDWLERSYGNGSTTPLTKASNVDANTGKPDANQKDFISTLFGDVKKIKSLPPEEIEKLNKKIHLLPPAKKREALLAMGYKNIKAIEIADALGITVAEFNNIMNVNEGDI